MAYTSPCLWSVILINGVDRISGIKEGVKRAKQSPLTICLDMKFDGDQSKFWEIWNFLKEKASQWESLFIANGKVVFDNKSFQRLIPSQLPSLIRAMTLVTGIDALPGFEPSSGTEAPRLRSYTCQATPFFPFAPQSAVNLTSICISHWRSEVLLHVAKFPCLETLEFSNTAWITPNPHVLLPEDMPSLRHIRLDRCGVPFMNVLLRGLKASNLRSIEVTLDAGYQYFMTNPQPKLFPALTRILYRGLPVLPLRNLLGWLKNPEAVTVELSAAWRPFNTNRTAEEFEKEDCVALDLERDYKIAWVGTKTGPE